MLFSVKASEYTVVCVASSHNHFILSDFLLCTWHCGVWNTEEPQVMGRRNEREDELTLSGHLCQDKTNPESENHLIRAIADK